MVGGFFVNKSVDFLLIPWYNLLIKWGGIVVKKAWTKEQEIALKSKNSTIVSASAGSGKTAVLTEKVFNYIMDGTPIRNILVMTFSTKAADEMKERIITKINDKIQELQSAAVKNRGDGLKIKWLYSQLNDIPSANIQTIHSFCKNIIKKYYYLVDVDPRFSVADELTAAVLKNTAIKNIIEKQYEKPSELFNSLYMYIDNSSTLESVIVSAYDDLMPIFNPYKWLNENVEAYNINLAEIPDYLYDEMEKDFSSAYSAYQTLTEDIKSANKDKSLDKALNTVCTDANILNHALNCLYNNDISSFTSAMFANFGETIRFPKDFSFFKDERNSAKETIIEKYKKTNFNLAEELTKIKNMYPVVKFFEAIIIEFGKEYKKLKGEHKVIDFSDMEQLACTILQNPAASTFYKDHFAYVFVDEYQDTSPIQEEIINKVSSENNLFCVGDLKQSIYRFRSSDPLLFKSRLNGYKGLSNKTIVNLNQNFRSNANILNCANDVFTCISAISSEIEYGQADKLVLGRQHSDSCESTPVKLCLIDNSNKEASDDVVEAYNLVNLIKSRVGEPIYDPELKETRQTNYGDITILSRKIIKYSDALAAAFIKAGIPFEIEKNGNLFETIEIKTLIALLELIINRLNDLNLILIMHQGLFGFSDQDILSIRNVDKDKDAPYYNNIKSLAAQQTDSLSKKCASLMAFLDLCNEKNHLYTLSQIISYVIDRSNINDVFAVRLNGKHKVENIKLFCALASNYEKVSHGKVYSFLKFLNDIKETTVIQGEAAETSPSYNKVKITTIHKSKGLEYPIVILAYMGKNFSSIDKRSNIIVDRDAGIGFKYFDSNKNIRCKNALRTHIENVVDRKNREEEMRLLYVAMTRAKEEMIIQGIPSNNIPLLDDCSSMFDWILSAVVNQSNDTLEIKNGIKGYWELSPSVSKEILSQEQTPDSSVPIVPVDITNVIPTRKHYNKPVPVPKSISASCIDSLNKFSADSFSIPKCMQSTTNATDVGTIVHKIMRYGAFKEKSSPETILKHISDLVDKHIISLPESEIIPRNIIEGISAFTCSDLYKTILASNWVIKEAPFYTTLDSSLLKMSENHNVLTRCIIDLAFENDTGITIVDYKTDNLSKDDIESKIQHHKKQLDIYSKCLSETYNKPVIKRVLVFLSAGMLVTV